MRPYTRSNRLRRPSVDRAKNQIRRTANGHPCPLCGHPLRRHAPEAGGPVCTRSPDRISCPDCAEAAARQPLTYALAEIGRSLRGVTLSL